MSAVKPTPGDRPPVTPRRSTTAGADTGNRARAPRTTTTRASKGSKASKAAGLSLVVAVDELTSSPVPPSLVEVEAVLDRLTDRSDRPRVLALVNKVWASRAKASRVVGPVEAGIQQQLFSPPPPGRARSRRGGRR